MARTRASAKAAGRNLERLAADYLKQWVSPFIDRRVKTGSKDRGDLANVRFWGNPASASTPPTEQLPVVVECKNTARIALAEWAAEAEAERINDGADVGLIVSKRHGRSAPGDQWVHMTLRDLATLLSGRRPQDGAPS